MTLDFASSQQHRKAKMMNLRCLFFCGLAIIVWCLTTCFIFFQQTLLLYLAFPLPLQNSSSGYLRGCLIGDSSQLGPQIKHNSAFRLYDFFSSCLRKAEDSAFQENPNSTYLWGLATCSLGAPVHGCPALRLGELGFAAWANPCREWHHRPVRHLGAPFGSHTDMFLRRAGGGGL